MRFRWDRHAWDSATNLVGTLSWTGSSRLYSDAKFTEDPPSTRYAFTVGGHVRDVLVGERLVDVEIQPFVESGVDTRGDPVVRQWSVFKLTRSPGSARGPAVGWPMLGGDRDRRIAEPVYGPESTAGRSSPTTETEKSLDVIGLRSQRGPVSLTGSDVFRSGASSHRTVAAEPFCRICNQPSVFGA
jgi:hypothetical protein